VYSKGVSSAVLLLTVCSFHGDLALCWQAAGDSVEKCECLVAECHESSEPLKSACSPTAFVRVTKQLGKLDSALDDVRLNLANTTADQELETYHVDNYDNLLQVGIVVVVVCERFGNLHCTFVLVENCTVCCCQLPSTSGYIIMAD